MDFFWKIELEKGSTVTREIKEAFTFAKYNWCVRGDDFNTPGTYDILFTYPLNRYLIERRQRWSTHYVFAMWFIILRWAWTVSLAVGVYTGLILSWFQNYQVALTHWGRDKTVSTLQPTFFNTFSWKKMDAFRISLRFVSQGPIKNIPALWHKIAWRGPGNKPLSEPMMVRLPTHICVTRPLWVDKNTTKIQVYHRLGLISNWDVCPEIFSPMSWCVLLGSAECASLCFQYFLWWDGMSFPYEWVAWWELFWYNPIESITK